MMMMLMMFFYRRLPQKCSLYVRKIRLPFFPGVQCKGDIFWVLWCIRSGKTRVSFNLSTKLTSRAAHLHCIATTFAQVHRIYNKGMTERRRVFFVNISSVLIIKRVGEVFVNNFEKGVTFTKRKKYPLKQVSLVNSKIRNTRVSCNYNTF